MKVYEQVLGNSQQPLWAGALQGATVAQLVLDEWELQKSRLRRVTSDGVDIAVNLERGTTLHEGDVLDWDPDTRRVLLVHVQPKEVMHVRLEPAAPDVMIERALKLGHVLGNQHWAALVKGTSIYVPMAVNRMVMSSVMNTHSIPGVTFTFESGAGLQMPATVAHDHESHGGDDHHHGDQHHHHHHHE